jgi:hypothetical protein
MADIFNEIDDDLRHERYRRMWDRYGVIVLGVAAAIVVGVAGWRGYEYWRQTRAEAAGDQFYAAMRLAEKDDAKGAAEALGSLANAGPDGYRFVARLQAAAISAKDDRKAGLAAFDAVARDAGAPKVLADLAAIQAAYIALDSEDAAALEARLSRFLVAGQAFRHAAREILMAAAMKAGNWADARKRLDEMQADAELPQSFQRRLDVFAGVIKASAPAEAAETQAPQVR